MFASSVKSDEGGLFYLTSVYFLLFPSLKKTIYENSMTACLEIINF